jgi:anti-anti-sigma factor
MTADSTWRWLDDEDDAPACPLAALAHPRHSAIVILGGDYDRHNEDVLLTLLADAVSMDDSNLVLDLGGVEYLGASTVQIIRRTSEQLASESRSLTLRSPSPVVKRALAVGSVDYGAQLCHLPGLLSDPI